MLREKAINRSYEAAVIIREKKMNSRNELVATEAKETEAPKWTSPIGGSMQ